MGGAGPIPLSEILAYAQYYEMRGVEERAKFLRFIGMLDGVYLDHQSKKSNSKTSSK